MARVAINASLRDIARQLGVPLHGTNDPMPKLVAASVAKVRAWCEQLGPVSSFEDLIDVVSAKLKVHFEVVRDDSDLRTVKKRYLNDLETGFLNLEQEFDQYTDAVVIRLQKAETWSDKHYVAVIDARRGKKDREWFSKWHELSHLIAEPQTKFVFRRTQLTRRDPVERLMDQIASELAFYGDLLLPLLKKHRIDLANPSLRELARFRDAALPFASLHATLIAVLKHVRNPCILIEAKQQLNASEQKRARQISLLSEVEPTPRLRAISTVHNPEAIRRKIYIHRWMRVPKNSVIRAVHDGDVALQYVSVRENLGWWESQGESLQTRDIDVEAMQAGSGRVLALVRPVEGRRARASIAKRSK